MGDSAESGPPELSENQTAKLKSSSTNVRIEALRKLLHTVQGVGTSLISS